MRLNVGLPKEFWVETTNMAVYVINQSPGTTINLQMSEKSGQAER